MLGLDGIHKMSNPSLLRGHLQAVSSNIWLKRMDISKVWRSGTVSIMCGDSVSIIYNGVANDEFGGFAYLCSKL